MVYKIKRILMRKNGNTDVTASANAHVLLTKKIWRRSEGECDWVGMFVNELKKKMDESKA